MKPLIFSILLCAFTFAQIPYKADSLMNALARTTNPTQKAKVLVELSIEIKDDEPARALKYAQQAYSLALKTVNDTLIADALMTKGRAYIQLKQTDSALIYLGKSGDIFKGLGNKGKYATALFQKAYALYKAYRSQESAEAYKLAAKAYNAIGDKTGEAECYNSAGLGFWGAGHFGMAIDLYRKALSIYEDQEDLLRQGRTLNNIGTLYWGLGSYNNALKYYQRSIYLRRKTGDLKGVSLVLNNIGLVYKEWKRTEEARDFFKEAMAVADSIDYTFGVAYSKLNLGTYYQEIKDYDRAIAFYMGALEKYRSEKKLGAISMTHNHLGDIYLLKREYSKALENQRASLKIARSTNNRYREAIALNHIADIFADQGKNNLALTYAQQSLEIANDEKYRDLLVTNGFLVSKIREEQGHIEQALQDYKTAAAWQDSLFNYEKMHEFTDLQIRYNLEQKDAENALLRKNNEIQKLTMARERDFRNLLLVIAGLGFVLVVLLVWRYIYMRRTNRVLKDQNNEIIYINRERQALIEELQSALDNVKTLSGLLPICSSCKKIRDDQGYWNELEKYISVYSQAKFSHSLCPDCADDYMDELEKAVNGK